MKYWCEGSTAEQASHAIVDIRNVLRKLEPLLPGEVAEWRRNLDLLEPGSRIVLEKHIRSKAWELLGDVQSRLLLPPPPAQLCTGALNLGTVAYTRDLYPFNLRPEELLQNLAIFGRSGSGKTNIVFHLLQQLQRSGIPFLFLDWKRTARHLLPFLNGRTSLYTPGRSLSPIAFNPLLPPPAIEIPHYINLLVDVIAGAYSLGEGSKSLLQQALSKCYSDSKEWPTIERLEHVVAELPAQSRALGWKTSALRAIRSISFSRIASNTSQDQEETVRSFLRESTIIELNGLHESAKKFLIPIICLWIYHLQLQAREREKLKLVIVVEEAHHTLYRQENRSKESVMNMLLRQCRELGIGMVIVDQHPHLISSAALGNTFTTICLNLRDPTDINKAAGLLQLEEGDKTYLSSLPVGQGIIKLQDRWHSPFLLKFPLVKVRKGWITDERLKDFLAGNTPGSGLRRIQDADNEEIRQIRIEDIRLERLASNLLGDVLQYPADGVRQRYGRLGVSMDKGNRLKRNLVEAGLLDEALLPYGTTRRLHLRLSANAKRLMGASDERSYGGIAHEYWKEYYARALREQGYAVVLEAPRKSGRVDVLASNGGERVAIEVETGKSDVVQNVREDLRLRVGKVVVVVTDEIARAKIERQLARAGLLIEGRVEVCVAQSGPMAA